MVSQTESEAVRERCEKLCSLFGTAPMKRTFGMQLRYEEDGSAVFEMPFHKGMQHALGDTHGGVIATLLDNAGWFSVASQYDTWINTVELSVRLLEPAKKEALQARGEIVRAGKRLAVARMQVTRASGALVAVGSGTFTVSDLPLEPANTK